MAFNRDLASPQRVRTALSRFAELGITLPKTVIDARDALTKIEKAAPKPPAPGALAQAILDGASEDEQLRIAMIELTLNTRREGYSRARAAAAEAVFEAIRASKDEVHQSLSKLATAAIEKLRKTADVHDVPLEALVRAGRHKDAELIASANVVERQLEALYRLRQDLLWPADRWLVQPVDRWFHPDHAGHGFIEGLRVGGRLWFPTFEEAAARAGDLQAQRQANETAVLATAGSGASADE